MRFTQDFLKIFVVTVFSNTLLPDIKCLLLLFLNVSTPRHPCQYDHQQNVPPEKTRVSGMPKWLHGQTPLVCTVGAYGAFHLPWSSEVRAGNDVIPEVTASQYKSWNAISSQLGHCKPLLAVPVDNNARHSVLCRENVHK